MVAYVVLKLNADIKSTLFDTTVDNIKEDRTQNEHYTYKVFSQPQYRYSLQTIDFIVGEIKKNQENIIQNLNEN